MFYAGKFNICHQELKNRIGDEIVSVLASSAVYRGSSPDGIKPKTIKLLCVDSQLSTPTTAYL